MVRFKWMFLLRLFLLEGQDADSETEFCCCICVTNFSVSFCGVASMLGDKNGAYFGLHPGGAEERS